MDNTLTGLLLLFLLALVTLNFAMTIRLVRRTQKNNEQDALPFTATLGAPMPAFSAKRLVGDATVSSEDMRGTPSVLVFLSSTCGDCRKFAPELATLLPEMRAAGVALVVVGLESETRVRRFLTGSPLIEHALLLNKTDRLQLNPRNSAPFYLFVDDQLIIKASNFIGDENWRLFVEQLRDVSAVLGAAEAEIANPATFEAETRTPGAHTSVMAEARHAS